MIHKKRIQPLIIFFLLMVSVIANGQTKQEKIAALIQKMNLLESYKLNYTFQLEEIKYLATEKDSIQIVEVEKKLSPDEITKRITASFNELFSEEEMDKIYDFFQSSAFEKLERSFTLLSSQFNDIDKEIERLKENISSSIEKHEHHFVPIAVDKEDGIYETLNYSNSTKDNEIALKENPSLTSADFLEVKKFKGYKEGDRPEINIVLTKEGAKKFYLITKENIDKPLPIVIDHHIVSMPIINSAIMEGKVSISGNFTEEEADRMIESLKSGQR